MKTIKKNHERKNEILDVAESLFYEKGYERATINDILKEINIAKGTFYYYFKSKEEVMDAIILRYKDLITERVEKIIKREEFSPVEKLMHAFMAMQINDKADSKALDDLHKPENALLHQKILSQIIELMTPFLVNIIDEGVREKVWSCKYSTQYMQIFLAASLTLTDEGIFEVDDDSEMKIMVALISVLEMMLEVGEGSFMELFQEA